MILAGDVGGTKTHLALYDEGASARHPRLDRKLASGEADSLEALLGEFLRGVPEPPTRAVFGIAGPVVDGRADTTNLPWDAADARSLASALGGARVTLLNDLVTTAHGLSVLTEDDLAPLHPGRRMAGNRALIAAGTGLGEAFLLWEDGVWLPSASEGGHADFASRDELEDDLLQWLRARYGRVSYERVLSGHGLADLYRFLRDSGRARASDEVRARFEAAPDPAAVVSEAALEDRCPCARMAVERFVSVYGAEAGNLALKALATGGVFVGGGIAPRIAGLMEGGAFARAFETKGRLTPLLEEIPVSLVLDPQTALWGAAVVALAPPRKETP